MPLPPSLAREGGMMLESLLADLLELPGLELITTRDPRLPPLALPVTVKTMRHADDVWPLWRRCIDEADAIWPIAPESGGILEKIGTMAQPKKLLGCAPSAIRIAGSKYATASYLARHGIPVVVTCRASALPQDSRALISTLIAKPDDGAGCEDARLFAGTTDLLDWLADGRQGSHVVQPWLPGEAASLSMLCCDGKAQLLSCNRQLIEIADDTVHYRGSLLNGMAEHWNAFEVLAGRVAHALPGLAGYVGVDVMVNGSEITVLEINPRLTTSYTGLRRATGLNPAGLVLDLLYNGRWIESGRLQRNVVEVKIDG
ncbi:ATP-grasp domain-containing protein [Novimethylophilus sp.]|uniref:ATP-grasp domain-containing protein n=1 Tax=Novimethylophilus sp. TaxID=2137426 RepID=UPI002F3EABB5